MPDHEPDLGFNPEFKEPLTARNELIKRMQDIAPSGQGQLDIDTIEKLRDFTMDLLAAERSVAESEYDRFESVEQRGLNLDTDKLREQLSGKTLLVTGGTGCIGSTLISQLTEYNPASIVSVSRGITQPWHETPGVDYQKADIRNGQTLTALFKKVKPDIVYHLAAQRDPGLAEVMVQDTLTVNITGTSNVMEASKQSDTPQIVYTSTGKTIRPFTPDTYAASKKAGEILMADAAQRGEVLYSGVRFTHVVDNSIIRQRLQNWIATDAPIRLHGADIFFYMQSARESANLLLNAGLNVRKSKFDIHAIRDLDLPINLLDLALGAVSKSKTKTPIYFFGFESGYEKEAYPGIYDPSLSGGVSPLINGLEATQADPSETCAQVDRFPFLVAINDVVEEKLQGLKSACEEQASNDTLHRIQDELSWAILDARLRMVPVDALLRTAHRMEILSSKRNMSQEDQKITRAIQAALEEKQ